MDKKKYKAFQNIALVTQIGISMIIPIMAGLFIGQFIDEKVGTRYLFMFIFIIMGVISAFLNLYKIALRDDKKKR